jgi:hypothetical protein
MGSEEGIEVRSPFKDGSFSAAYALTDSLSVSLGSDIFTGGLDGRGTYAAYRDLSSIWMKGIYRF